MPFGLLSTADLEGHRVTPLGPPAPFLQRASKRSCSDALLLQLSYHPMSTDRGLDSQSEMSLTERSVLTAALLGYCQQWPLDRAVHECLRLDCTEDTEEKAADCLLNRMLSSHTSRSEIGQRAQCTSGPASAPHLRFQRLQTIAAGWPHWCSCKQSEVPFR